MFLLYWKDDLDNGFPNLQYPKYSGQSKIVLNGVPACILMVFVSFVWTFHLGKAEESWF